jgi:carbohydrate-selective porin OprB
MELLIPHRRQWFQQKRLVLFVAAAFFSYRAMAQETTGGQRWFDQDTMTGNWGGSRSSLRDAGIDLRAHFTTESAGNPSGGNYQAVRYTQQIDFGANFDLDRLMSIKDSKIQVTLTDRVGSSLSADALRNQFAVQELYGAGQNFRLAEMNYQQDFLKHKVTIELGWSPIGDSFAGLPYFCNFQNAVICGHASAMTTDSGAHNFPTAEWGARMNVSPTPDFYVAAGLYQVNPNEDDADNGFDLSFRSTGAFVPVELGWLPGQGSGKLPGVYKIGGFYNSSETPDVFKDVNGHPSRLGQGPGTKSFGTAALHHKKYQPQNAFQSQGVCSRSGFCLQTSPNTAGDHPSRNLGRFLQGEIDCLQAALNSTTRPCSCQKFQAYRQVCTDLNSVCYNSVTEHGQMLGVAIACGRFLAVFHTVHLLSIWYRKLVIFGGID